VKFFARAESDTGQVKELFSLEGESVETAAYFCIGRALDFDCADPTLFVMRDGKMAGWANWLYVWELGDMMPLDERSRGRWEVH
jgi:hypothetical protein